MNPHQKAIAASLQNPPPKGITREFSLVKMNVRESIEFVSLQLQSLGIAIGKGSRFDVYWRVLQAAEGEHGDRLHEYSDREQRALAEMQQLVFILLELPKLNHAECVPILKRVVCGEPMPEDEPTNTSSGRDYQFELLIAAACARSKYPARLQEPPDIFVNASPKLPAFGIAAKRVRKERSIPKRVKEGVRQLSGCKEPGMVFVDCSLFLMRSQLPVVESSEQGLAEVEKRVQAVAKRMEGEVRDITRGSKAFGVVYHALLIIPHTMNGYAANSHWWGDWCHIEKMCLLDTFMHDFECAPFALVSGGFIQQRG